MTDIQGNYNISYNNGIEPKKAQKDCQSPKEAVDCNDKLQLTNLNDSPAAISGKAMVKPKGEYKFDPQKVENDVLEFKILEDVKEMAETYKAELIQNGCDEKTADEKARMLSRMLTIESI